MVSVEWAVTKNGTIVLSVNLFRLVKRTRSFRIKLISAYLLSLSEVVQKVEFRKKSLCLSAAIWSLEKEKKMTLFFLSIMYMFPSFSCHAESVCANILFLQQQYLIKTKSKEVGVSGINGRWTSAASTWRYSLLAWRNCSPFHWSFRKSWQVLSSSFCKNLDTLAPWVVPRFNTWVCLNKNNFANDSLWTKIIFGFWHNFKPSNGYGIRCVTKTESSGKRH